MTDLEAPITEATVYTDRALVTRKGTIQLTAGEHEIRINNLPQFIRDSLRAAGRGPQGTQILNVDITTAFHSRPPENELLTLQTELDLLLQKNTLLEASQQALYDRRQWLRSLGEQSKDFAKGISHGQIKAEDCAQFFRFMATQALEDSKDAQQLQIQQQQLQQEIAAKQRELNHKQGSFLPDRLAALITLSLPSDGIVEVEISYLIEGASWYPHYDVRVQKNEETNDGEVELTYVGVVQQTTGEAWQNVNLSLSTARPSLAAKLPEVEPWYLNVYTPPTPAPPRMPAPKFRAAALSAQAYPADADMIFPASATVGTAESSPYEEFAASSAPVEISIAAVEHTGTALVFRVGRSVDIPSDNTPHKTTIARDNLPCEFDYVSAPILEANTHLRATITNVTTRILLAGDASIFLSGEYVGTTHMKMTAPNEEFKIFLGLDDNIKVKRELVDKAVDKGNLLQSDLRRITYAYQITIHNYASQARKVIIQDHLPVANHERIKVRIQTLQPAPTERTKLEVLTWEFRLPANGEVKIEYRFVVEHPQNLSVIGLP